MLLRGVKGASKEAMSGAILVGGMFVVVAMTVVAAVLVGKGKGGRG